MQLMGNLFFKVRGRSFQQTRKIQALDTQEFKNLWAASKLIQPTWTSLFGNVDLKALAKWSWQTGKVHWEI
jgi:hypothetical protein